MLHALPMPVIRPPVLRRFVPYIYTRNEVRILLRTTRASQRLATCGIDSATLRTFLVFLYATGALVGEALGLLREDVDLKKGAITIRGARFNRSRTIPIGPDLQTKLRRHVTRVGRKHTLSPHFFLDKQGKAMSCHTLRATFQKLRRLAGIRRQDGAIYQPRMHDLRYTFAVHRLTSWFRQDDPCRLHDCRYSLDIQMFFVSPATMLLSMPCILPTAGARISTPVLSTNCFASSEVESPFDRSGDDS